MVDRPQGSSANSVAYCCRIITVGESSVLTMQTALVELMTAQLSTGLEAWKTI
jgi:hypothetical protein